MWYLVLAEGIALAVLYGLWRAVVGKLVMARAALTLLTSKIEQDRTAHEDYVVRYEKETAALRKELSATYEALDDKATPDSVRADLNRLLAR
jgi:hypothetical protein